MGSRRGELQAGKTKWVPLRRVTLLAWVNIRQLTKEKPLMTYVKHPGDSTLPFRSRPVVVMFPRTYGGCGYIDQFAECFLIEPEPTAPRLNSGP